MFYNEDIKKIYEKLNSTSKGLSNSEALKRLEIDGKNILPKEKRPSIWMLYLKEIISPIEIILIITVIVSFFAGETLDALVILFIILVDTIMGTYQENKALKSAESLNSLLKNKSLVLRDEKKKTIDSENVVLGDIIFLESGDKIPADARLIEVNNLQVDESVLTGESLPVNKTIEIINSEVSISERKNMVYAGCNVTFGRAKAIVVATGINTEIGKIFKQVTNTKQEKTPLTKKIDKFTKQISVIILIIAFISTIILYVSGYPFNSIFLAVVALAISAMPEGLPLALTLALTIAANKMSKKHVIVKKLNSVEALGSCTVIASDKTGTLTLNEQTARKIVLKNQNIVEVTGTGYNDDGELIINDEKDVPLVTKIINLCALNNEAYFARKEDEFVYHGDSIDVAFLALKSKFNTNINYKTVKMISYESEKQFSAVFYKTEKGLKCTVKGSIEKVMSFSKKDHYLFEMNEDLSKEGYRVIAVCDGYVDSTKESDIHDLDFLGLVAFIDPVREEVKDSIKECQKAGIKVMMITGDHPSTALAIAKELDIASSAKDVITGMELENAFEKGEEYFDKCIKDKKVFSRVSPTDKLNIVESLKRNGEFVAVTGDGVNDAPAIKAANIGVAMGSGTDIAIDTADMIITDDNFASIVSGVKEGRIAYANIRKIILFLLSCGLAEILFYLLAVALGYELPLVAIQLLWLNVVTDGLQDIALSFERGSKGIMRHSPRKTSESIFDKELAFEIALYGITIAFMVFAVWKYLMDKNVELLLARSIIMTIMVFIQNMHVLNCRSETRSVFKQSLRNNPLIFISVFGSILLQIIVIKVPFLSEILKINNLALNTIAICFVYSLVLITIAELYKMLNKYFRKD